MEAEEIFKSITSQGIAYFNALVGQTIETNLLDFKTVIKNTGAKLQDEERRNLSKALGGFANSDGGVIVWGVNCRKDKDGFDVVQELAPIQNLKQFHSLLTNATPEVVEPPIIGIKHHVISSEATENTGYLITYVPKLDGLPVQSSQRELNKAFYCRSGSSFYVMTQSMLADRFGRRPQAKLELVCWSLDCVQSFCSIKIGLRNTGRGTAYNGTVRIKGFPFVLSSGAMRDDKLSMPEGPADYYQYSAPPGVVIPPGMTLEIGTTNITHIDKQSQRFPCEIIFEAFADGFIGSGKLRLQAEHLTQRFHVAPFSNN